MELLTEDEIAAQLSGTPGWAREGTSITCSVTREDFRAAMLYAGAVAYLASTDAAWTTGQTLVLDGGLTAHAYTVPEG